MRLLGVALTALLLSACEAQDKWRYQRVLWEKEPEVQSPADARAVSERVSGQDALTVEDCYRLALHRSEALAISGEELVRIQTSYEQAVGSVLPRISFKAFDFRQEDVSNEIGLPTGSGFLFPDRAQYQFYLRQPIFNGLKEFYAIRQSKTLYGGKEEELRHARLVLFADVAEAFYDILAIESRLAITQDALKLAQERLEELVQRQKAGISRRSEVLAQEAETASTEALVEQLRGALEVAWEALKFLTALPEQKKLTDTVAEPGELPSLEALVQRALARRHDISSLEKQVKAAREARGIARAGYLPTLLLEGNYYTYHPGFTEAVDWDLTLSFEAPLFEGGVTQARLREADSFIRTAELRLTQLLRNIRLDVNRGYAAVKTLQSQLVSLEKAVASAQENYDIVQAEYRRNIVTNIEVLASFNTLQNAKVQRDGARWQLKVAGIRLTVQTGAMPGEDR